MSGLLDSLSAASRSLTAARLGIDVAGQNLANINTEGYSRRTALLAEEPAVDAFSAGRGVTVLGVRALRDELVESRLWNERQGTGFDSALVDGLTEVEGAVGLPGASIDERLSAFFDAFKTLADDPTSSSGRDNVVSQSQQLAQAFRTLSDRLTTARRNADVALGSALEEVNQLANRVAVLNDQISQAGSDVESLRDERAVAVGKLTELADVTVTRRSDGGIDLSIGSGRPLVIGTSVYQVSGVATPPLGLTTVMTGGYDVTGEIAGGRIGGLLQLRDTVVPGYATRLDQLAYDIATQVNTLHQAGYDARGTAAGALFAPMASATGAAAAIAVDGAVAGDSQLVAASSTGAVGDNETARTIAALRDARVASGGTATAIEAWGQFSYRVGADLAAAKSGSAARDAVVRQLEQLRARVSGVSMDEEAANLIRFQRAYEANARYFRTIVDTLDTLMSMVRS